MDGDNSRRIQRRNAAAIVELHIIGWFARERLGHEYLVIARQRASHREDLLPRWVQVKVQLAHIGVVGQIIGGVKAVAVEVQSTVVARRGSVSDWILLEYVQYRRTISQMLRVNLLQLCGTQRLDAAVAVGEGQNSLSNGQRWHVLEFASGRTVKTLLIVEKEKDAIFLDRAAYRETELITDQGLARDASLIVEPVVGGKNSIAIKLIKRTVKPIGSALGDQRNLASRAAPLICTLAAYSDAEFLDGIERYRQRSVESGGAIEALPIEPRKRERRVAAKLRPIPRFDYRWRRRHPA